MKLLEIVKIQKLKHSLYSAQKSMGGLFSLKIYGEEEGEGLHWV